MDSPLQEKNKVNPDNKLEGNKIPVMPDVLRIEETKTEGSSNVSSFPYQSFDSDMDNC